MSDDDGLRSQSRATGRVTTDGQEIRLMGPPFLPWDPAKNNLSVPDKYRGDELIADRYFYSLPQDVISAVVQEIGVDRFDVKLLAMERELSAICGDHASTVGFWHDGAIPYRELRPLPAPSFSDDLIREAGMTPAQVRRALQIYRETSAEPLARFTRAYCGWLLTNRHFLDEHDALLAKHSQTVRRWGAYRASPFLPKAIQHRFSTEADFTANPAWTAFREDCSPFLVRWRLSGLAGPYLPIPSTPLMAGVFPLSVVDQLMNAGGVFYLPDTMPLPSRDQLRNLLEHALHRGPRPEHLEEWLSIVRAENPARNQMAPFIRLLELQHYWRILHQRHAAAIHRRIGGLETAFGAVFQVTAKQIHNDLAAIRTRLGRDWLDRAWIR